jgi:hypothetical protein
MTIQVSNFPTVMPALTLDLTRSQYLDPRITFTRASSGTVTNSAGQIVTATTNEARFDHNPVTGESLGLLVEEQRTNLLLLSADFDNVYWDKTRSSIGATKVLAPDGSITGAELIEDTSTNTHQLRRAINFTSGVAYTISIFAKATVSPRFFQIQFPSAAFSSNRRPYFDVVNGTAIADIDTTVLIQPFRDGWYRCSATMTATVTTSATFVYQLSDQASTVNPSYTGDGTSGIHIWGAQLEAGAFPTSYIPTTTAAVTRSADVASITGSDFISWYRADAGTVFSAWSTSAPSGQQVWTISNATLDESIRVDTSVAAVSNNTRLVVIDNNSLQAGLAVGLYTPGSRRKTALAYQQDNFAGVADGAAVVTDTAGTLPTVDRLFIGANWAGSGGFLGGPIRRITFWPTRLSNASLQTLTQ